MRRSFLILTFLLPLLFSCGGGGGGGGNPPSPPVSVTVSPASVSLRTGETQTFTAAVSGSPNPGVAWSVIEPGGGTITAGGTYHAPAQAGSFHVRATAAGDPSRWGEAVVTVTAVPTAARILLLHHSTGGVIWNGGLPAWFAAHNAAHGTAYQVSERSYPDAPYPWQNDPYDYWNLWVNPSGPADPARPGVHPLGTLAAAYDVIVFKHCFPVSDVEADTGSPDAASSVRRAENYKLQYAALKARLRQFPATRFVLWTGAARIQSETTAARAQRAADFFAWVKTQWDEPGDNIWLWDFRELETEGGLYLKGANSAGDSHPGAAFAQRVAPYLGQRLVNVIEGRGDTTRLDGNDGAVTTPACNGASLGPGASLQGYRPFPPDSPWNLDISAAPVDPDSAAIIAFIGASRGLHPDFGAGLWDGGPIGIPYQVVDGTQAKVRVRFTAYGDESDPGPMPVPPGAPVEGGPGSPGDRHVLVLDRSACMLYELYRAFPQADGSWNADSAAVWDLKSNALRPFGWTSADAAGLPIFPGLARYDEVAAGEIPHALRFTAPTTRRAYVLPATHWASSTTNPGAPPMGTRVRLKASVDVSGFPAQAQVVLRALKKHGMILADNGSAWYIGGAPDERWNNDALATLSSIKGSDLEVVQLGTVHTANPAGDPPAIASFTASPATVAPGGASTLSWSAAHATRFFVTPEVGWAPGSATVRPTASTTYTLTAQGPFGSATRSVTVTVAPAAPAVEPRR
ncbi:MAG: hypothetical protein HY823_13620 [Acidobacteria bacterium]|nr:hypothetical protein [Acidobacteriota bacterium]